MIDIHKGAAADRAPVVFLSGAFGRAREWAYVAGALGRGFDPVAYESPNAGLTAVAGMPSGAHVIAHGTSTHVALAAAATAPWAFRSLTLVDADVSAALPDMSPSPGIRSIIALRTRFAIFAMEGDALNAAREEIDFWIGTGAFLASSTDLQSRFAACTGRLAANLQHQAGQPLDDRALAGVVCPVLAMSGYRAPSGLRDTHRYLARTLPFARETRIPGAGVCSHLTDPHLAGPEIRGFLARTQRGWHHPSAGQSVAA